MSSPRCGQGACDTARRSRRRQLMDLPHVEGRERDVGRGQLFDVVDGFLVIDDLEVLAQALAPNGEPGLEDQLRFTQCERAALNRIGVIDLLDRELLLKAAHYGHRERS